MPLYLRVAAAGISASSVVSVVLSDVLFQPSNRITCSLLSMILRCMTTKHLSSLREPLRICGAPTQGLLLCPVLRTAYLNPADAQIRTGLFVLFAHHEERLSQQRKGQTHPARP
ncbi:hypothetical protein BD626DRAFT_29032 [Schizophyllum amplum]|uniref:Uncharacterized protein n=1 Tax=Schizophyllum amplum TaxID=97359 RepID=A0A550D091_9AGAR|nr:hypothetical protein BD626DRAFT_29032 [Auriculariopsis ampla]